VVIFNTVSMSLHERREELAITRAMGAGMGDDRPDDHLGDAQA
jgi:ABC-type antimicrobial peptide transport system permease subunit